MVKKLISFVTLAVALAVLFIYSVNTGSISLSYSELIRGLFVEYNETVAIVYDLRFPRIIIAILGGGALAVSGVMLQAVLKNPLADPTILGISSGAACVSTVITAFFPAIYFLSPLLSFFGGLAACVLVYSLSYRANTGFAPIRIILVGVAVSAVFSGIASALNTMGGKDYTGAAAIINANISLKTWEDVKLLLIYTIIGLIIALFLAKGCNLMALEDKTIRGLGVNVSLLRLIISLGAVLLASITTAVVGAISFIGLIVPHIGRLLVGNDHRVLIPYSALLGAFVMLAADTAGRLIAYPNEVSPAVIMSIVGGPVFILLLKRGDSTYGS